MLKFIKSLFAERKAPDNTIEKVKATYNHISTLMDSSDTFFQLSICEEMIERRLLDVYPPDKVKGYVFILRLKYEGLLQIMNAKYRSQLKYNLS